MDSKITSRKRVTFSLLLLTRVFASTSFADLLIEEQTETIGPAVESSSRSVTKIKGQKTRSEQELPELSAPGEDRLYIRIKDAASGDEITLNPKSRTYRFTSGSANKQGLEMAKALIASGNIEAANMPDPSDKTENRATGNHVTISGQDAEEYVWEKKGTKITTWFAKNFPNGAKIRAEMDAAEDQSVNFLMKGNAPDVSSIPGIEMRRQIDDKDGTRTVTTVNSIKEQPLLDSEFAAPEGYEKADY